MTRRKEVLERTFPVRVRIGIADNGGREITDIERWLEVHAGRGNFAHHGADIDGQRDVIDFFFVDAGMAKAFVDRWSIGLVRI